MVYPCQVVIKILQNSNMMFFKTEIREVFNKKYLKIYLKDATQIEKVRKLLSNLPSVKNVNITENREKDLTIYPSKVYDAEETEAEITFALNSFFSGSELDPVFTDVGISTISDKGYSEIIKRINSFGKNLEKYKNLYDKFDEEGFRDFFLPHLNSISVKHTATGETFNKIGKTDILIQDENGNNIFIAECKLWKGEAAFLQAIDQLLSRYVTWRDEKVAIIIFNKDVKSFTGVISTSTSAITKHPLFNSYEGQRFPTSYSYTFRHPDDEKRIIKLELILFNCQ